MSVDFWKTVVQKQLKTEEDVFEILRKKRQDNLVIHPLYAPTTGSVLPQKEESPLLVCANPEDPTAYAYFLTAEQLVDPEKIYFYCGFTPKNRDEARFICLDESFDKDVDGVQQFTVDIATLQNAGASPSTQLAVGLAKIRELIHLHGPDILNNIVIRVAVGHHYFVEIAKIRALKIVFATLAKEYSLQAIPYIFAETTLRNKTKLDPENNLIRSTLETAAGMLGGADAIFSQSFQVAPGDQTELSWEIAYKQGVLLAYESILNVFQDAGAGSGFIEEVTQQLCENAWALLLEIEEKGGYLTFEQSGELVALVKKEAIEEHLAVASGEIKLVGANIYPALAQVKTVEELYQSSRVEPVRWSQIYE